MRSRIAIIILAIMLVSCKPVTVYAPTQPIATEVVISTKVFAPTHTLIPTLTQTPSVWPIWFRGFSCEGMEICESGPNQTSQYFSINSDGTDLKPLQISAFPSPELPDNAPPLPDGFATVPQVSPDKSMLTYSARDGDHYSLYIVDISSGEATALYQTKKIQDHLFWIGTACWTPNGETIQFLVHSRIGRDNQAPVLYTIDRDGNNLQALFNLPGLENAWFGTCSPDGKELVLSIPGNWNVAENGLYLINRNTGHSRQILSSYFAHTVRTPHEIP